MELASTLLVRPWWKSHSPQVGDTFGRAIKANARRDIYARVKLIQVSGDRLNGYESTVNMTVMVSL